MTNPDNFENENRDLSETAKEQVDRSVKLRKLLDEQSEVLAAVESNVEKQRTILEGLDKTLENHSTQVDSLIKTISAQKTIFSNILSISQSSDQQLRSAISSLDSSTSAARRCKLNPQIAAALITSVGTLLAAGLVAALVTSAYYNQDIEVKRLDLQLREVEVAEQFIPDLACEDPVRQRAAIILVSHFTNPKLAKSLCDAFPTVGAIKGFVTANGVSTAEQIFASSLEAAKKIYGSSSIEAAQEMVKLAAVYMSSDRLQDAEKLLEQAYQITTTILGPRHPSTFELQEKIGDLYSSEGKPEQAEQVFSSLFRSSIDYRKREELFHKFLFSVPQNIPESERIHFFEERAKRFEKTGNKDASQRLLKWINDEKRWKTSGNLFAAPVDSAPTK